MKKRMLATLVAIQAFAWQPVFEEYRTVQIGESEFKDLPIDLYGNNDFKGYPAPTWMDYNGDGLNDLVIGLYDRGSIMVSENVGTADSPQFDEYRLLTTNDETSFTQPI